MSDETRVYEVFAYVGDMERIAKVRYSNVYADGHDLRTRCALIPIGDGLMPGTRVRDVDGRTCAVVGPAQVDGIAVPASAFTVVQYGDLEVESIGTASLTPIPDEPRTYTEEQVREAVGRSMQDVRWVDDLADAILARLREGER